MKELSGMCWLMLTQLQLQKFLFIRNHKVIKKLNYIKTMRDGVLHYHTGGTAKVADERMSSLFAQLLAIKPKRLAARDESKWSELQVDSTGSRVKVFRGFEINIGSGNWQIFISAARTMNTFVRLYNDKDVYEVDGFLDMTFNQGANIFRDGTVISSDL